MIWTKEKQAEEDKLRKEQREKICAGGNHCYHTCDKVLDHYHCCHCMMHIHKSQHSGGEACVVVECEI